MSVKFHTLRREQWIPRAIEEVFNFFSDARNLEEITPPWLHFRILAMDPGFISEGTKVYYRLRLHGIPIHWTTEIRQWDAPHRFVDVQRSGPFRLWHHTHCFEAHKGRTRMIDIVRYRLPLGILGRMVHALKVRGDLRRIFDYRRQHIHELFKEQRGRIGPGDLRITAWNL
ncbi:SRPBCC family protein [Bryobacter aggregatus]|uniref:SRPBCC family protein n=1 Tax=Bryobacter aggregatus TaxID=360054 RepID=UPI0006918764|nr:SRPBCC family protein [Bryobacter aggregatus]